MKPLFLLLIFFLAMAAQAAEPAASSVAPRRVLLPPPETGQSSGGLQASSGIGLRPPSGFTVAPSLSRFKGANAERSKKRKSSKPREI